MVYRVIHKKFDLVDMLFHYMILFETANKELADKTAAEQRKVYKIDQIEDAIFVEKYYPTTVY